MVGRMSIAARISIATIAGTVARRQSCEENAKKAASPSRLSLKNTVRQASARLECAMISATAPHGLELVGTSGEGGSEAAPWLQIAVIARSCAGFETPNLSSGSDQAGGPQPGRNPVYQPGGRLSTSLFQHKYFTRFGGMSTANQASHCTAGTPMMVGSGAMPTIDSNFDILNGISFAPRTTANNMDASTLAATKRRTRQAPLLIRAGAAPPASTRLSFANAAPFAAVIVGGW